MLRNRTRWLGLALATLGTSASCYRPDLTALPDKYENVAKALDNMQWYVEAYGYAAISTPLLVQPDATFKFNLTKENPDTFFDHARSEVNGRSASLFQSDFSGGLGVSGSVDMIALQQYLTSLRSYQRDSETVAEKQRLLNQAALIRYQNDLRFAESISDPERRAGVQANALSVLQNSLAGPAATAAPAYPTAPTSPSLPTLTAPSASDTLSKATGPQGLYPTGRPAVTGATRSSLLMAAGDTATYAMLSMRRSRASVRRMRRRRVCRKRVGNRTHCW